MLAVLYSLLRDSTMKGLSYERGDMSYSTDIHPKYICLLLFFIGEP